MGRRGLSVPLPFVHTFRDRHKHVRRYYRRPGWPQVALPADINSPEFMPAYEAARDRKAGEPIGISRNAPGSVASAIGLYLGSTTFADLAPDTRRGRRNELERFRVAKGDLPVGLMEARHIEKHLRGKSRVSARNCLKALSPWLDWCVAEQLVAVNPASAIKRPVSRNKVGYKAWTDEYIELYRARHPVGTKARTALEVLVNVGSARVDTAPLGRQHVRNGMIVYRRSKTKVLVEIPILPDLQKIIDELPPARLPFIAKENGAVYTKESFGNLFRSWCDEARIPKGYSAHGIRKYATKLRAELGATMAQLMAWFGWLTASEAAHYIREADRRRLAQQLGQMVNAAMATRDPVKATPL